MGNIIDSESEKLKELSDTFSVKNNSPSIGDKLSRGCGMVKE